MINFEKVSFEQFKKDSANLLSYLSEDEVREVYDKIEWGFIEHILCDTYWKCS